MKRPRERVSGIKLLLLISLLAVVFIIQSVGLAKASTFIPHSPISINGDSGFVPENGVTGGSGTPLDPYIIEGWEINAAGGTGISVQWTNAYFIIRNAKVYGGGWGISFLNVWNGKIIDSVVVDCTPGIAFDGTWGPEQRTSSNNFIINCTISGGGGFGIVFAEFAPNNTIMQCTISDVGWEGIMLWSGGHYVTDCTLIHNGYGANLLPPYSSIATYSPGSHIYHNNFIDNAARPRDISGGNYWDDGYPSGGNYWSNYADVDVKSGPNQDQPGSDGIGDTPYTIDSNNIDRYPLMVPWSARAVTVYINGDGSVVPSSAPISSLDNVTYTFTGNISYPSYCGIVVERSNIVVDGNGYTLQGPGNGWTIGISVSSTNVTIRNMSITNFQWADIVLNPSSGTSYGNNTIYGNNITGSQYGVMLNFCLNNTVYGNNITDNEHGVVIWASRNNTVYGNNITANYGAGIWFGYSSYNTVIGNNITANCVGIWVWSSTESNNTIYHNSFVNNGKQVSTSGSPLPSPAPLNVWNDGYPSGGNYWSDYTGVDVKSGPNQDQPGSDGIGDTPYTIDSNNMDHYPLMSPWTPAARTVYLTVSSLYGLPTPTSGSFSYGTSITASVVSSVAGPAGTQYVCTGWTGNGDVPASGSGNSVTFSITQNSSITWNWKTQYNVTFSQTGIGSDFAGTIVTIDGTGFAVSGLPLSFWWDVGSQHTFSYPSPLIVTSNVKQYVLAGVGASSPYTVSGPGSIIGTYQAQYLVAASTGVGIVSFSPNSGTISYLTAVSVPSNPPAGQTFPFGFFTFDVVGVTGQTVTLAITFPENVPVGGSWWKYESGAWYSLPIGSDNGDKVITVIIKATGGTVVDPGGLGIPSTRSIGGEWAPITMQTLTPANTLQMLAPWISLASTMAIAVSFVGIRRKRKRQD